MYESYYGFKENPFSLSPDPRFLLLCPQHREALNHLIYGIQERKGFIVITGGIGTGKTTLCRSFLACLDGATEAALIFNPAISELELLETIVQEFGLKMDGRRRKTKKRYIDALNAFLLDNYRAGKNAVLLIDEAQNLSHSVMEQIRLISNLETEREKLLQIVLIGQPELGEMLKLPSLRQLRERIVVWYELKPLKLRQIEQYIDHRLSVAGGGSVSFSALARMRIFLSSEGNPRRINAVCDRALLIAYSRDLRTIGGSIVGEAVRDIGRRYAASSGYGRLFRVHRLLWGGIIAACTLILIGLVFRDRIWKEFFS